MSRMTEAQAIARLRAAAEDDPDLDGEADELFAAIFGRAPDDDGDAGDLISACYAALPTVPAGRRCECGAVTGERCCASDATVYVEWMPECWRESHISAGGAGSWPHNGSARMWLHRDCADRLLADDAEWARVVGSEQ